MLKLLASVFFAVVVSTAGGKEAQVFKRKPVVEDQSPEDPESHRQLYLNGGLAFIATRVGGSTLSCLVHLPEPPHVGVEPCRITEAPPEQLWYRSQYGHIQPKWRSEECLDVDNGDEPTKEGDKARVGECSDTSSTYDVGKFFRNKRNRWINVDINKVGPIQLDENLCLKVDNDELVVAKCGGDKSFKFEFMSGWYSMDTDKGCVAVQNANATKGAKIVSGDCGREAHWRMDSHGLLHSRLNDDLCMQPGKRKSLIREGRPLRLYKCNKKNIWQQFDWDSFEAPISLKKKPNLYLGEKSWKMGSTIVISKVDQEYSGDFAS